MKKNAIQKFEQVVRKINAIQPQLKKLQKELSRLESI